MRDNDSWLEQAVDGLSPRPWAYDRVSAWLDEKSALPMLLIEGDPGSGKSSLVLQVLSAMERRADGAAVLARLVRSSEHTDPFDGVELLGSIIEGLGSRGISADDVLPTPIPRDLGVDIDVTTNIAEVQARASVFGVVLDLSSVTGQLGLAERLIRSAPEDMRGLIVVDALDQAEDEGADDFLKAVAAIVKAASGTGVRILCTTRTTLPIGFDPDLCESFDLIGDATDDSLDLRAHLDSLFPSLDDSERTRVISALIDGAEENWLWATTTASVLQASLAAGESLPSTLHLTKGLDGLYRDGIRRIQQRFGQAWESAARPLMQTVACAFDGRIGETELRWITGHTPVEIEDAVKKCEPFLHKRGEVVRLFHPDFSRWLLAGNVSGLREEAGHLAIAKGLTALGRQESWGEIAEPYAAARVVDHWCAAIVLDPFSPAQDDNEKELSGLLEDRRWAARAGGITQTIEQAGSVSPALRLPGSLIPLSAGFRAVRRSGAAEMLVGSQVLSRLPAGAVKEFDALLDSQRDVVSAQGARWLEERLPDLANLVSRTLWLGVLDGHFTVEQSEGTVAVGVSPDGVVKSLRDETTVFSSALPEVIIEDMALDHLESLIVTLEDSSHEGEIDKLPPATVLVLLGSCYRKRADSRADETARGEDLALSVAAFKSAAEITPLEFRIDILVDVVNTLHRVSNKSLEDIESVVAAEEEILKAREEREDPKQSNSANLLGAAYQARAVARDDKPAAQADLALAVAAYRKALTTGRVFVAELAGSEQRLWQFAIDLANALMALDERTDAELEELIDLQKGVAVRLREAGVAEWTVASNLLGDAYRERSARQSEERARREDLDAAVAAYREAVKATSPESDQRLNFVIDLANALATLPAGDLSHADELIRLRQEIADSFRRRDRPDWPEVTGLLGSAYQERAEALEAPAARDHDFRLAAEAFREAATAIAPDDERRLGVVIDLANSLARLSHRTEGEIEELVSLQQQIADGRKDEVAAWVQAMRLLGDAYRERSKIEEDESKREADVRRAIDAYRAAAQASESESELARSELKLAGTLMLLPERTRAEIDELIVLQGKIEAAEREEAGKDTSLKVGAMASMRGDAYRERAALRDEDDPDRATDLELAVDAYRQAVLAPSYGEDRLRFILDLANTLMALAKRTDAEIDELIELQREIVMNAQQMGHAEWPASARLLGDAYLERSDRRTDDADREADVLEGLFAYRAALYATPADHASRLSLVMRTADVLWTVRARTLEQTEDLIGLQEEIIVARKAVDDGEWPRSAVLLGDAFHALSVHADYSLSPTSALESATAAYLDALTAIEPDADERLDVVIKAANDMLTLPRRDGAQVEALISLQQEILTTRKAAGDESWPRAARILGQVYAERGDEQSDEAERVSDLELALETYRRSLSDLPEDSEYRLELAVFLANAMLVLAAIKRSGGKDALAEGTDIVAEEIARDGADLTALRSLLPVLGAALKRQGRWRESLTRVPDA